MRERDRDSIGLDRTAAWLKRGLGIAASLAALLAPCAPARAMGGQGHAVLAVRGECSIGAEITVFAAARGEVGTVVTLLVDTEEGPGTWEGIPVDVANGEGAARYASALRFNHVAPFRVTIPDDGSLVGRKLHLQAIAPDPAAPGGHAVTNRVTIGVCARGESEACDGGVGRLEGLLATARVTSFPVPVTLELYDGAAPGEPLATVTAALDEFGDPVGPAESECGLAVLSRASWLTRCTDLETRGRLVVHFAVDAASLPGGVLPDTTTIVAKAAGTVTAKTIDASCGSPIGVGRKATPLFVTRLDSGPSTKPVTFSGRAFADADENGVREAGEAGIAGVWITLHVQPSDGEPYSLGTSTADDGSYAFAIETNGGRSLVARAAVAPGAVSGQTLTTPATTPAQTLVVCGPSGTGDFGFAPECALATFSGIVFADDDADGERDGSESGLAGVTVTLHADPSDGEPFEIAAVTGAAGGYSFSIPVTPGGTVRAFTSVSVDAVPGRSIPLEASCAPPADLEPCAGGGFDFPFAPECDTVTYWGFVYCDDDDDRRMDDGETGIAFVPVTIHVDPSSGPSTTIAIATDEAGRFEIDFDFAEGVSYEVFASVAENAVPGKSIRSADTCTPEVTLRDCGEAKRGDLGFRAEEPGISRGDFVTFTQGGWGSTCRGENPGCFRDAQFATAFPGGLILGDADGADGDDEFALVFTTAEAIREFLPAGGRTQPLESDETDPDESSSGVFGGQLLAAALNVGFNDAGLLRGSRTDVLLGDLVFVDDVDRDLRGLSVRTVLALAHAAIANADAELPEGVELDDVKKALAKLNECFDDGDTNEGTLGLP